MKKGNLQAQMERMEKYLSQDKENISLFQECLELAIQLADFKKAQALVDEFSINRPNEPLVIFSQSKINLGRGDYENALTNILSLKSQGINNAGILYNQVWAQLNLNQFDLVINSIEESLEFIDEYPRLLLVKARALHHTDNYQQAIDTINQYLVFSSTDDEAFGLKALLLLDIANYNDSKIFANKALSINPNNHEALIALSSLALNEQEPDEALKYLSVNTPLTQKSGRMMLNLGQVYMLNMQFEHAEKAIKEAVSLMPSHIGSWHVLAWVEIVLNKICDAKRCFEKALELNRNFSESHGGLAVVAIFQNELDIAKKLTTTALKLDPLCFSGRYAESLLLEKSGDINAAKSKLTNLLTQSKSSSGLPLTQMIKKANERLEFSAQK